MERRIKLSVDKINEIVKKFKVTQMTVYSALGFRTNSGVAKTLRAAALQRGGEVVVTDYGADPYTYWREVPHQMVQLFGVEGRVELIIDIKSSYAAITADGKVVKEYENSTFNMLPDMQNEARVVVKGLK